MELVGRTRRAAIFKAMSEPGAATYREMSATAYYWLPKVAEPKATGPRQNQGGSKPRHTHCEGQEAYFLMQSLKRDLFIFLDDDNFFTIVSRIALNWSSGQA
jgi:hypothetical protein